MNQQLCQIEPKIVGHGSVQDAASLLDPVFDLVRKAQRGDKQSLGQLAQQARVRLRTYVYRLTQREDLAQEIVQESLLEMCKVLGKLRKTDRFWPWLYGIAVNKLRHHQRTERTQRKMAISSVQHKGTFKERQNGLEKLVSKELKQIVSSAMQKLKTRHKAVLVMRCYDGMKYSEIAESMGCSEFSTRMLFMRAKKSLQKELSRNGFGKGSLLAALILFGKMTAPSEAAAAQVTVTAAATKVGLLAGLAGLATTKTAIVSLTAAGALTAGTIVTTSSIVRHPTSPAQFDQISTGLVESNSNAEEEYWYYFPQGPDEPMMLRAKSGSLNDEEYSQILQNDRANYYYHDGKVSINNYRFWARNLSVLKIPTDDPELTDFLCQVEGSKNTMKHISAPGRGLMVIAARGDSSSSDLIGANSKLNQGPWLIRHYNVLDEDYFQGDWPATAKIIDNRDAMHKRGWTYFRVTGQLKGQDVNGMGRIPFVYITSRKYSPWLKLQVGSTTIVDTYREAYIQQTERDKLVKYKGGSFFKGLARPWMGLHTIDTVRRDAAEQHIWFEARYAPDLSKAEFAEVELLGKKGDKIIYKIDMEKDVVDEITFSTDQGIIGNLKFSYLQSVDGVGDEFTPPAGSGQSAMGGYPKKNQGLLWLVQLVEGSLE
jgi:RNA polymerase sigma-70 factor (ECF subfamily)